MIEIQEEEWWSIRPAISTLWRQHYEEIAEDKDLVPLDPDWDKYDHLAETGCLSVVTVRSDSELVGYVFAVVDTHLHYKSTLFAMFDIYWIRPDHRRGYTAVRMFRAAERVLADRGVTKVLSHMKLAHDHGPIFERMGWRAAERVYAKTIGA